MAKKAVLLRIDKDLEINRGTDVLFLYALQRCLLLDLKEYGLLTEIQLRFTEEKLQRQLRIGENKPPGR